ncbi:MAG: hypothetical protein QGD94_04980, partial [Planctomycetia bacterium]|nr:hypothetical protein [Planctomycetia bacterium]
MRRSTAWATACLAATTAFLLSAAAATAAGPSAKQIVATIGAPRGIVAILGDTKAELALKLANGSELTVYVQLADAKDTEVARRAADKAGMLNSRVYIDQGSYDRIHLADNLADVVVVAEAVADKVAEKEVLRVLRPEGKGFLGTKTLVKAFPEGVDDWSVPTHDPSNSMQSTDEVARAPHMTQFIANPAYAPTPIVSVTSHGRIFRA